MFQSSGNIAYFQYHGKRKKTKIGVKIITKMKRYVFTGLKLMLKLAHGCCFTFLSVATFSSSFYNE